jgi:lipopolysaccharide/colanic/teichoic acid biosynthesis glycosyltransferase
VSLDCHYIENWSLGFDLWIILRTAAALLGDPDAY